MIHLSVNINKIALIRNSRGGNVPDVVKAAIDCQKFGADGITVHPRPDERHIRYQDVRDIKPHIVTELNVEGYPSSRFMSLVLEVKPHQVTLVPDPPNALTSNQGWNVKENFSFLCDVIKELKSAGIRTSIFVETELDNIEWAAKTGTDRVELYTEPYARIYEIDKKKAIEPYIIAAKKVEETGMGLNAGHDLNLKNLRFFAQNIPNLLEVSIGHALISDALYYGLENTIKMYKEQLIFLR